MKFHLCMFNISEAYLNVLLFALFDVIYAACVDKTHFYYTCDQLKRYCSYPQAVNIRMKCPVTCNVCTSNIDAVNEDVTNSFTGFPPSATPRAFQTASSMSKRNTQTFPVRPLPINLEEIRRRRPINVEAQNSPHEKRKATEEEAFQHIQKCCISNGLKPECRVLCRYDTQKDEIISKALSNVCNMEDAKIWTTCAASGQDNTQCCANSQPPVEGCEEFCRGEMPTGFSRILQCLNNHLHSILSCHKNSLLLQFENEG